MENEGRGQGALVQDKKELEDSEIRKVSETGRKAFHAPAGKQGTGGKGGYEHLTHRPWMASELFKSLAGRGMPWEYYGVGWGGGLEGLPGREQKVPESSYSPNHRCIAQAEA